MKNYLCTLLVIGLFNGVLANHIPKPLKIKVISEEIDTLTGQVDINLVYYFRDTVNLCNDPALEIPSGWSTIQSSVSANTFYPGDSLLVSLTIGYPISSLPFYSERITIRQPICANNGISIISTIIEPFHIYFTPYNTVEIWNNCDFNNLKRNWLADRDVARVRQFILKDSIPLSNIPDNFTPTDPWQEDFQQVFIDGLAYAVPMMATHPDFFFINKFLSLQL